MSETMLSKHVCAFDPIVPRSRVTVEVEVAKCRCGMTRQQTRKRSGVEQSVSIHKSLTHGIEVVYPVDRGYTTFAYGSYEGW